MLLSQQPRRDGDLLFEANTNGTNEAEAQGEHRSIRDEANEGPAVPLHPLGIKPLGNLYFSSGSNARASIGSLQALPDETVAVLLEYLDQSTVRQLGYTCKFLFAFCSSDDLWKSLFLE
jgi:hypothetical protein